MAQSDSTYKAELSNFESKFTLLKDTQKTEINEIMGDEKTLSFIKEMRGFKKSWQTDKAMAKRKSTAGQMAEATKNWIGSYE